MAGKRRIRILVVDDHADVRRALMMLLADEPDLEIAGEAAEGRAAVEMTGRLRPDVVLADVRLRGMSGVETTRAIRAEWPQVQVIGLSMAEETEGGQAIRQAGAVGYVSKLAPPEVLIAAIRACRPGQ